MESLKEYLKKKQETEVENFDKAKTGREQESAFAARYALADVEIKLKETQREILGKIAEYIEALREAIDKKNKWGREHFYRIIVGILIPYRIVFGKEEYEKITNEPGDPSDGGVDLEKLKKVLEDLK